MFEGECLSESLLSGARVRELSWEGSLLVVMFENVCLVDEATYFVEARSKEKTLARVEALALSRPDGIVLGTIDVAKLCDQAPEAVVTDVSVCLAACVAGETYRSDPANEKSKDADRSFRQFFAGMCVRGQAAAVPDMTRGKDYVLRIAGLGAVTSGKPYACEKKNRPWSNCVLLKSMAHDAVADTARAIESGTLDARVRIAPDGAPSAECHVNDVVFDVDLSSALGLEELTLVNEGQQLLDNLAGAWTRELHADILESMQEFDELCRSHGAGYLLAYGTLLGAVRHANLIPWDYDADFYMLECEYLKLRRAFDTGDAPANRQLDDWMSVPGYPGSFGRFMKVDTTQLANGESRGQGGLGGFGKVTDVFYLIPAHGGADEVQERLDTFLAYDELANRFHLSKGTRSDSFVARYDELAARCEAEGRGVVLDELQKSLFNTDDGKAPYYIATASSTRLGEAYPAEWLEPVMLDIAGHAYPAPKNYLDVLRVEYGPRFRNYPHDRTPRKGNNLYSDTLSYKVVERAYLDYCDPKEVLRDRDRYKELSMQAMRRRRDTSPKLRELELTAFVLEWEPVFVRACDGGASDWERDALVRDYLDTQLDSGMMYWPVFAPVSDEVLQTIIEHLVTFRGDAATALELLDVRRELGGALSAVLEPAAMLVNRLTKMRDEYEYGRVQAALEIARQLLCENPKLVEARELVDFVALQQCEDQAALQSFVRDKLSAASRTASVLPLASACVACKKLGRIGDAIALMNYACDETDDGMIIKFLHTEMDGVRSDE